MTDNKKIQRFDGCDVTNGALFHIERKVVSEHCVHRRSGRTETLEGYKIRKQIVLKSIALLDQGYILQIGIILQVSVHPSFSRKIFYLPLQCLYFFIPNHQNARYSQTNAQMGIFLTC